MIGSGSVRFAMVGALPLLFILSIAAAAQTLSLDIRVASGNDDAEESLSGSMPRSCSDLELADDGTRRPNQTIAMRFLGIPPGSKILNAHVQFQVDESDSGAVDLVIRGQASGVPAAFSSSSGDITSRPVTTASVAWSPPPWTSIGAAGVDQRTPDLAEILRRSSSCPTGRQATRW